MLSIKGKSEIRRPFKRGVDLPVRLVSRLTTEFALMNLRQSLRLVPGQLEMSIVAQAFLRCGLPELTATINPSLPSGSPMIGSISSVARSFKRSPETIRRHVHGLAEQGFFVVEHSGVRLAPRSDAGTRILEFLRCLHDNMLWLVEELDSWGLVTRRARHIARQAPLDQILRTALDLRLLGYEIFGGSLTKWTSISVFNALSAASVRHVTRDRTLSSQFVVRSTPDALRRPISIRALSMLTGLPYATVWRHLSELERGGKVGRKDDGYVVLTGQLLTEQMEAWVTTYVRDALARVDRLVAAGLDPTTIPSSYFEQRPSLVSIP